jgi:hypothetical protein
VNDEWMEGARELMIIKVDYVITYFDEMNKDF